MSVHDGSFWIDNHSENVPTNRWLAVGSKGLIEQSDDIEDLYNLLKSRAIPFETITIAFLPGGIVQ